MNDSKFDINKYSLFFAEEGKKDLETALYALDDFFAPFEKNEYQTKHDEKSTKRFGKAKSSYNHSRKEVWETIQRMKRLDESVDMLAKITKELEEQAKTSAEVKEVLKEADRLKQEVRKERIKSNAKLKKCVKSLGKSSKGLKRFASSFNTKSEGSLFVDAFVEQISTMPSKINVGIKRDNIDEGFRRNNQEVESKSNDSTKVMEESSKRMDDLLYSITDKLSKVTSKDLKSDIRKETKAIRITKPKLIKISKQNLERLRKSEIIITDLEMISKELEEKNIIEFSEKISKLCASLQEKLKSTVEKMQDAKDETTVIQSNVDNAMREARSAAMAYNEAISENTQYDREAKTTFEKNRELEQKRQELLSQRQQLAASQGLKVTGQVVQGGEVRNTYEEIDNRESISSRTSEINRIQDEMGRNSAKLDESRKSSLNRTTSIPERYKNMKKKLEEMSKLKQASKKLKNYKGAMGF